jgi:hypothetical protein
MNLAPRCLILRSFFFDWHIINFSVAFFFLANCFFQYPLLHVSCMLLQPHVQISYRDSNKEKPDRDFLGGFTIYYGPLFRKK